MAREAGSTAASVAAALGAALWIFALSGHACAAKPPPVDYADAANWLCRPDRPQDACGRSDQDSTVVLADGSTRVERFHADPDAPVDCFYVYPTVSTDPGANASMRVEPAEIAVVNQQFARFAAVCRPFAPLYRQVTLTALRAGLRGHPMPVDRDLAYQDVKAAWKAYLAHDNHGRGVVLIGHSQGSLVLARLVREEIDGKPVQARLLSAILAGYYLQVPVGRDVGGDFKSIPLCRSARQIGCAFNFASYRADSPPPPDAKFGLSHGPGLHAACVNPAAPGGGSAPLRAYLSAHGEAVTADGAKPGPWTRPPRPISTPFVQIPSLLSAECSHDDGHNFLAISLHPTPGGARTDAITGDVILDGRLLRAWGLHLIDMNLTMGDLLDDVRAETRTYLARPAAAPQPAPGWLL